MATCSAAAAPAASTVPPARERLLAAAERILAQDGRVALTTRAICGEAATNISQISYYFGSLDGLLDTLLAEELGAVSRALDVVDLADGAADLPALMDALLAALRTPAVYARNEFAALVVEAICRNAGTSVAMHAGAVLDAAHGRFRGALAALLPGLTPLSIRIRLTAIIAVAMAMLPRSTGHRLLALQQGGVRPDDAEIARETRALSLLAWLAEPECS